MDALKAVPTERRGKMICGIKDRLAFEYQGSGHVVVVGGPGSGKTRSFMVPTVVGWPGPALVVERKDDVVPSVGSLDASTAIVDLDETGFGGFDPFAAVPFGQDGAPPALRLLSRLLMAGPAFSGAETSRRLFEDVAKALFEAVGEVSVYALLRELEDDDKTALWEMLDRAGCGQYRMMQRVLGEALLAEVRAALIQLDPEPLGELFGRSSLDPLAVFADGGRIVVKARGANQERSERLCNILVNQTLGRLCDQRPGTEVGPGPVLVALDDVGKMELALETPDRLSLLRYRGVQLAMTFGSLEELEAFVATPAGTALWADVDYCVLLPPFWGPLGSRLKRMGYGRSAFSDQLVVHARDLDRHLG